VEITGLHLHPIKSCHGFAVERATIGRYGLVGDREWQVVGADGSFLTQRTHPTLTGVHPALVGGGVVLRADGMEDLTVATPAAADTTTMTYSGEVPVGDGGADAAAWFSTYLGEPVRFVGIAPGYRRHDDVLFPTEGNLGDSAPVLVVNEASHHFLVERAKESFGMDRWRANIVVGGAEPWAEDTWRHLRLGDATVECVMPWPRCAVPQVDQDTGARHKEPAVVLKAHRWCAELPESSSLVQAILCGNALFGMASSATPEGAEIAVGDEVEVTSTQEPLLRT
jgi:uncharacterized protein YcbX